MRAEDMFDHYKKMRQEMSMIAYQLSHFSGISEEDIIESLTFTHPDGEKVQTSDISRKTESIAIKLRDILEKENNDWYGYLLNRYEYLDKEISFFEHCVREMGEKKSDILFELLDGDLTWNDIADQYGVSRSLLGVYRKQAIKEINKRYQLREEQELAYLLS